MTLEHFCEKKVGHANAMQVELNGVKFHDHGIKEPDYVTCHFATYVTLERMKNKQINKQTRVYPRDGKVTFQCPQIIHDHFHYRDSCDNHNGSMMFPIAIEEQLGTRRWIVRSFKFFMAVTEVNVNHVMCGIFN